MSPTLFFTLLLLIGILFVVMGKKTKGKTGAMFIALGIIFAVIGGYGVFTSFL